MTLFVARNDFNIDVLKEFVQLHEFSDMILVQALRYVTVRAATSCTVFCQDVNEMKHCLIRFVLERR